VGPALWAHCPVNVWHRMWATLKTANAHRVGSLPFMLALGGCGTNRSASLMILERTCSRYATATAYMDSGTLDERYPSPDRSPFATPYIQDRAEHARYRTAFVRPGKVRFDFQTHQPMTKADERISLWSDGLSVHGWADPADLAYSDGTVLGTLEAQSGVTSLSAAVVPMMLLGAADWLCHPVDVEPVVVADDVDGCPCRRISMTVHRGSGSTRLQLCVDSTFAVRQWRTRDVLPSGVVTAAATLSPLFDVDVPAAVFDFQPPSEPARQSARTGGRTTASSPGGAAARLIARGTPTPTQSAPAARDQLRAALELPPHAPDNGLPMKAITHAACTAGCGLGPR
jgi:hypothetical protein